MQGRRWSGRISCRKDAAEELDGSLSQLACCATPCPWERKGFWEAGLLKLAPTYFCQGLRALWHFIVFNHFLDSSLDPAHHALVLLFEGSRSGVRASVRQGNMCWSGSKRMWRYYCRKLSLWKDWLNVRSRGTTGFKFFLWHITGYANFW